MIVSVEGNDDVIDILKMTEYGILNQYFRFDYRVHLQCMILSSLKK